MTRSIRYGIISCLLIILHCFNTFAQSAGRQARVSERQVWLNYMDKMARPVIMNLAQDQLKAQMPVLLSAHADNAEMRAKVSYLEAFGRTLSGIAPWLQLEGGSPQEQQLRNQYREWALKAIANAVNPAAKDYMLWQGGQPLVDASFVALALIRAPWLWEHLSAEVQQQVAGVMKSTRATVPVYSNWLLFPAMIEAFLYKYDLGYDALRIEFGIREFTQHWYVGDGLYADGMNFHLDYYNSIVIHPYLQIILQQITAKSKNYTRQLEQENNFARRYAEILERLINADGSYPAIGRSLVYRGGVFHHLANMAYQQNLPASLKPAQVRSALTAMIKKTLGAPQTFNAQGWLNIGLFGSQPSIADAYITTGSLYICSNAFLPLGLPENDEFWLAPYLPWTAVKVWGGQDVAADHALDNK